jgi:hypothetical protein
VAEFENNTLVSIAPIRENDTKTNKYFKWLYNYVWVWPQNHDPKIKIKYCIIENYNKDNIFSALQNIFYPNNDGIRGSKRKPKRKRTIKHKKK